MKAFDNLKKHPKIFVVISFIMLCVLYLSNVVFIRYKLKDWHDISIDKNQSGLRTFYYSYDREWNLDFEKSGIVKRVSFSSLTDKKYQRNYFFLRTAGIFSAPKAGRYKFLLKSDDGSRLYIDQNLIIDNGGIHPPEKKGKTILLTKGPHFIVIEYFQAAGEAELKFTWRKVGEIKTSNNLENYFNPVLVDFDWNTDLKNYEKIIKLKENISFFLLWMSGLVILIWFILIFGEKIYLIWMKLFKEREHLCVAILLIVILAVCFHTIFFEGKTLVSVPVSPHVQDGGGPYWEIEPVFYLHHYFYFNIKSLPLWNPYQGIGLPLSAQAGSGSLCPLPFLASLCPSQLTLDFYMIFRLFIAGFFMYLFLKEIKIGPFAAFIGSVFFMLSPPHISCINQIQLNTIVFTPAILYFLEKAMVYRRKRDWFITTIFIALAILGGNPEEIFLAMSLVTLYFIVRVFFGSICSKVKCLRNYIIAVIIGLCMASYYLIPMIEYFNISNVSGRSYSSGINLNLTNLLGIIFIDKIPSIPPTSLYLGIIPFFLVLVAVFNFRNVTKSSRVYLIFSLIYISIFLSMLFNNPLTWWMKDLPVISHMWWSKYSSTLFFALTIPVVMGLNQLIKSRDFIKRIKFILIYALLAFLFIFVIKYSPIKGGFEGNLILFYYLFFIIACIVLTLKRNIVYTVLISLLVLVDLFLFMPRTHGYRQKELPFPTALVHVKKLLENDPSRVYVMGSSHVLEPNRSCMYQVQVFGYSGILAPKRFDNFLNFCDTRGATFSCTRRNLDYLGIKYVYCSRWPIFEKDLKEIYYDGTDSIYENKMAFPRAFIVHRAERMIDNGKDNILKRLKDPNFDLRHNIILEKDLPDSVLKCRGAPLKDNSSAHFINYTPNKILIKAEMENDGFLVLTDLFYPGWKAYVDGKRAEIYLTNYLVRSVYLTKGDHIVEFVYRPISFIIGVTITFIAFVCLMLIWWRKRVKV